MDKETVHAKMMEQVSTAEKSAMKKVLDWQFEVDDLTVYTTLRPRQKRGLEFLLRTTFDDFPRRAPSYVFVDVKSKEMKDDAWPPGVKHGHKVPGICTPGTREFYEAYHVSDKAHPWDHTKVTFLDTLSRIHQLMEHEA